MGIKTLNLPNWAGKTGASWRLFTLRRALYPVANPQAWTLASNPAQAESAPSGELRVSEAQKARGAQWDCSGNAPEDGRFPIGNLYKGR
jgi:hypothetical protein